MSGPTLPTAEAETRLRDAALVLLDLANEAVPPSEQGRLRTTAVYSLAVQSLLMAEELRPGAALKDRQAKLSNADMMIHVFGAAFGIGETVGCLREPKGQALMIMGAAAQLGEGLNRRNQTMKEMGFQ